MVPLSRANTWKRRKEGGGDNSFRGADKLDFLGASVVAERRACKGLETRGILLFSPFTTAPFMGKLRPRMIFMLGLRLAGNDPSAS